MNRRISLALLAACLVSADKPGAKSLVTSIKAETTGPGSIEDALHIRKASGTFTLREPIPAARLVVELYRKAELVDTNDIAIRGDAERRTTTGAFSVQVIDLDYLTLGPPKPGHLRFVVSLSLNEMVAGTTSDIAKDVFDTSNASGFSRFNPGAGTEAEAPLCLITCNVRPDAEGPGAIRGAGPTMAETIAVNKANDFVIIKIVKDR